MNIQHESPIDTYRIVHIEYEPDDYQDRYKKSVNEYSREITLPGFRKGKVPAGLVKQRYGKQLLYEILTDLSRGHLHDYIDEHKWEINIDPILSTHDLPNFDSRDDRNHTLTFHLCIVPDVPLNLETDQPIYHVKTELQDAEFDWAQHRIRTLLGAHEPVESVGSPSEEADYFCTLEMVHPEFAQEEPNYDEETGAEIPHPDDYILKPIVATLYSWNHSNFHTMLEGRKRNEIIDIEFEALLPGRLSLETEAWILLGLRKAYLPRFQNQTINARIINIERFTDAVTEDQHFGMLLNRDDEIDVAEHREELIEKEQHFMQVRLEKLFSQQMVMQMFNLNPIKFPLELLRNFVLNKAMKEEEPITQQEFNTRFFKFMHEIKFNTLNRMLVKTHPELEVSDEEIDNTLRKDMEHYISRFMGPKPDDPDSAEYAAFEQQTEKLMESVRQNHEHINNITRNAMRTRFIKYLKEEGFRDQIQELTLNATDSFPFLTTDDHSFRYLLNLEN